MTLAEKYKGCRSFDWEAEKDAFLGRAMSHEDELFFVKNTDVRIVRRLLGIKDVKAVMDERWAV